MPQLRVTAAIQARILRSLNLLGLRSGASWAPLSAGNAGQYLLGRRRSGDWKLRPKEPLPVNLNSLPSRGDPFTGVC